MQSKCFPVLGDAEETLVRDVHVGLNDRAARVLAYLLARRRDDDCPDDYATKLVVRVGTGLGRTPADDALQELAERELVTKSASERRTSGRPTTEWRVAHAREQTLERVYEAHAENLVELATRVADAFEVRESDPVPGAEPALSVALNWSPNGFHAPLFTAALGSYADCGLDVSFEPCRGSRAAVDRLTSGAADIALVGAASVLRAQAEGAAVVPVALLYQRAATALYTTRAVFGGEFDSVEQLRDRQVARPSGSETEALCRLLLSQAGVVDDVMLRSSNGEERGALFDGEADVVTGMATDLVDLRREGHEVDSILVTDHFPVYGSALTVREGTLRRHPSDLVDFLRATMAGWAEATGDPRRAAEAVARWSDRDSDHELRRFEMGLDGFARTESTRKHGWGWHSADGWRRLRTALDQAGVLTEPP